MLEMASEAGVAQILSEVFHHSQLRLYCLSILLAHILRKKWSDLGACTPETRQTVKRGGKTN